MYIKIRFLEKDYCNVITKSYTAALYLIVPPEFFFKVTCQSFLRLDRKIFENSNKIVKVTCQSFFLFGIEPS
jgi:hypothetical protein